MKIQWSSTAVADLESIREYIAGDSPIAARKVADRIKEAVNRLSNFPLSGRAGRVPGTRELVIPGTSYLLLLYCCIHNSRRRGADCCCAARTTELARVF